MLNLMLCEAVLTLHFDKILCCLYFLDFSIKDSFGLVKSGECLIFATANVVGPVVQRIE